METASAEEARSKNQQSQIAAIGELSAVNEKQEKQKAMSTQEMEAKS